MFKIKELASRLRLPQSKVLNDLTIRHRKKLFCKYDHVWYQFASSKEVIIPFSHAQRYAKSESKVFLEANSIHNLNFAHLSAETRQEKLPVVVLLGHYNHGKTSLLDSIGGTNYVSEEMHAITQVIRSETVSMNTAFAGGVQQAERNFTIIDTPGQNIFYRMRNYGASIADLAVLLVAADEGIAPQTHESIGIIEELGIPAVVCINKIDTIQPNQYESRLESLTSDLREFVALSDTPIIHVSVRKNVNISVLLNEIQRVAISVAGYGRNHSINDHKHGSELRDMQPPWDGSGGNNDMLAETIGIEELNNEKLCEHLFICGAGTVLNIVRSRHVGTALHVVLRNGEAQKGDSFSSGGWSGHVKSIINPNLHQRKGRIETAGGSVSNRMKMKKNKRNQKLKREKKGVDKNPSESSSAAVGAGQASLMLVTLHKDVDEPRPIGDTIRFHRGRMNKSYGIKDTTTTSTTANPLDDESNRQVPKDTPGMSIVNAPETRGGNPTGTLSFSQSTNPHNADNSSADGQGHTISPSPTDALPDFASAQEAAQYCMEQCQREVKLAEYIVAPSNVHRFGLERLRALFRNQKSGFALASETASFSSSTSAERVVIDGESVAADEREDQYESESESEEEEEEVEVEEAFVDEDTGSLNTFIVKADSDVTLGTLYDTYYDAMEPVAPDAESTTTSLEESRSNNGDELQQVFSEHHPPQSQSQPQPQRGGEVIHWAIGDVGVKDVMLARSGDATILAYNVSVEKEAARQALNLQVPIEKHDRIQDVVDKIVYLHFSS